MLLMGDPIGPRRGPVRVPSDDDAETEQRAPEERVHHSDSIWDDSQLNPFLVHVFPYCRPAPFTGYEVADGSQAEAVGFSVSSAKIEDEYDHPLVCEQVVQGDRG